MGSRTWSTFVALLLIATPARAHALEELVIAEGTVVVVDDAGGEHRGFSGVVRGWSIAPDGSVASLEAAVWDGAFVLTGTLGSELVLVSGLLAENHVVFDPPFRIAAGLGVRPGIELRGTFAGVRTIEPRSASGDFIDGIDVVVDRQRDLGGGQHPGADIDPESFLVRDAASPAHFSYDLGSRKDYFVRARGHAWQWLGAEDDEHLVLVRAATLELHVRGAPAECSPSLRWWSPRAWGTGFSLRNGECTLDGVPAGTHRLRAPIGWRWADVDGDEVELQLPVGSVTRVELTLEELPRVPRIALALPIQLPLAWGEAELPAELMLAESTSDEAILRRSTLRRASVDAEECSVLFADVPLGRHEFHLPSIRFSTWVEVRAEASPERISVPPPGTISLSVVDPQSGVGLTPIDFIFEPDGDRPAAGCTLSPGVGDDDAAGGSRTFRIPQGKYAVTPLLPTNRNLVGVMAHVDVSEVPQHVVLPAKILASLVLSGFWSASAGINEEVLFGENGPDVSGPGELLQLIQEAGAVRLGFSEPGDYELRFPTWPGYEPQPPLTLSLRRGGMTPQQILLRPVK